MMTIAVPIRARCAALIVPVVAVSMSFAAALADDADPYIKDLDIRQAPMAHKLQPPAHQASARSRLVVSAAVDRSSQIYTEGDTVALRVTATEDAYIWAFNTGTSGKVHQIYPNRYETDNFLRAGTALEIPGAGTDYELSVTHPPGVDLITVIGSRDRTPIAADMIDAAVDAGPFLALAGTADTVSKDLAITLGEKHPTWTKDQVAILVK